MDTDVLVAVLGSRTGASRAWLRAVLTGQVELLLSVPLAVQYEDVLCRSEQLSRLGVSAHDVGRLLDSLCAAATQVEISFLWRPVLRDPGDEMVLELAVQGRARWLLTFNERDFLGAERFGLSVMRPGPAWKIWQEEQR